MDNKQSKCNGSGHDGVFKLSVPIGLAAGVAMALTQSGVTIQNATTSANSSDAILTVSATTVVAVIALINFCHYLVKR